MAGRTDQGLPIRLQPIGGDRIGIRLRAHCDTTEVFFDVLEVSEVQMLDTSRQDEDRDGGWDFRTTVGEDGRFEIDEEYDSAHGPDGNFAEVEIRIEGGFAGDGSAEGTVDAHMRSFNAQLGDITSECSIDGLEWRADEPMAAVEHLDVPVDGMDSARAMLVAHGADLLVVMPGDSGAVDTRSGDEQGRIVHVDGATGETREVPVTLSERAGEPVEPFQPRAVAADGLWVVWPLADHDALVRIDLDDGHHNDPVALPELVVAAAVGHDALWTLSGSRDSYTLEKRDILSGEVITTSPSSGGELAVNSAGLWHAGDNATADDRVPVTRIDPQTLEVMDSFMVELSPNVDTSPRVGMHLTATDHEIFLRADAELVDVVHSLDPITGEVTIAELPSSATGAVADDGGLWTSHPWEGVVRRIEDGRIGQVFDAPRRGMSWITVTDDGALWLGDQVGVIQIDPGLTG